MKTIGEIKKELDALPAEELKAGISGYLDDPRDGVKKLMVSAVKKIEKLEQEKIRIEEMRFFEEKYSDFSNICGIDEAGRGPLAGPVVASAVILPKGCRILYVNDSKKLTEKKREELYDTVMEQALSVGVGMALSGKLHHQDYMTYVMLGDGEIQEGMVWEAAMAASHHDLKNLVAIVDCNGVQINGWVNDIMTVEPLADKWRAFGWKVVEVNGHNMKDVLTALHTAKTMRHPTAILMRTVKGKGVSFMEDDSVWHGSAPDDEQMVKAIAEIKEGGVV